MKFNHNRRLWFLIIILLLLFLRPTRAEVTKLEPTPISNFPAHLMRGKMGEAANQVLEDHTLFHQRKSAFQSTPRVYKYLWSRLSLASDMIRVLEFGKYKIASSSNGSYTIDTGTGVKGRFWLLYNGDGQKILYGEGGYSGWLIRNLSGRAIVSMSYNPIPEKEGIIMGNRMTVLVKIDNVVVDFLVKALNWIIRIKVRSQLDRASSSAQKLTEIIAKAPEKAYKKLRASSLIPQSTLNEFRHFFLSERNVFSFPSRALIALLPIMNHSSISFEQANDS